MGIRHFLPLGLLLMLLTGCAARFTNLTPQSLPRNAEGLYPFEVAVTSDERAIDWNSVQPSVRIGEEFYPMQPVPVVSNRWEALVPVPAGTEAVHYRYHFRFQKYGFGKMDQDSAASEPYQLRITEPKSPAPAQ